MTTQNRRAAADRDRQLLRFSRWIRAYPGCWFLICTPDCAHMSPEVLRTLARQLTREGFYEILFVLLTVHRNAPFLDSRFKAALLETIAAENGPDMDNTRLRRELAALLTE